MDIKTVGVVGAGQMGNGIAHVFALAGFDVLMNDISQEALDKAMALIEKNLDRQASRGKITEDERAAALARIRTTTTLTDLGPSDLIIEAATERETVKQAIFEDLLPHLKPHTILTTNTSSISITRLATRTDRPEKFMGFHFMNPVPVMQLVELIRGIATDDATYKLMLQVVEKLGKTAASAEDFPGLHRQPHPDADDQRGGLHALRGRRQCPLDRRIAEAGREPPDGAAGTGGLHRARYLPGDHERPARRAGRHQIPPLPAADQVCRGRLAGPQDAARLLRLSWRDAGADALNTPLLRTCSNLSIRASY
jgi:hypothetical protein